MFARLGVKNKYVVNYPASFGFAYETHNQAATIAIPAGAHAGDLAVLCDWCYSNSGIPAAALPSGWTDAVTPRDNGANYRGAMYFKKIAAGEPGSNVTGMAGTNVYKTMFIFRPATPCSFASYAETSVISASNPSSRYVSNGMQAGVVMVPVGMQGVGISDTMTGWSSSYTHQGDEIVDNGKMRAVVRPNLAFGNDWTLDMGDAGVVNFQAIGVVKPV